MQQLSQTTFYNAKRLSVYIICNITINVKELDIKRFRIANVLLAVYLTILAGSFMHFHESQDETVIFGCQDNCHKHEQCHGHLIKWVPTHDDCFLCDFFHESIIVPPLFSFSATLPEVSASILWLSEDAIRRDVCLPSQRAPPAFC